jgi:hypothetical protein
MSYSLYQTVSRSSNSSGRIRNACNSMPKDNPVKFRHIVSPVPTRWNSQFLCLESIHAMKDALLRLKFESDPDDELAMAIPDESQFEVLESMLVPLAEIKHVSEKLSADSKPTIHMCLIHLFNMTHLSRRYPETIPEVVPFLDCIAKGLEKRLPNFGREEPLVRTIFLQL